MNSFRKIIVAASMLGTGIVAGHSSAYAALTLDAGFTLGPKAGSVVEDFNAFKPTPNGSGSGYTSLNTAIGTLSLSPGTSYVVSGNKTSYYAAPWVNGVGGGAQDTVTPYVAIYSNGSASFTLTKASNSFGLLWGSVDTHNAVEFFSAGQSIGTITGTQISQAVSSLNMVGGPGENTNWGRFGTVYANISSDRAFDRVVLSSGGNSFEFDRVSVSPVPLPAALPLFASVLAAAGLIGVRSRLKNPPA